MNLLKFPLKYQHVGSTVTVTLTGVESDVFLVDSSNLSNFERGSQYTYYGGHYRRSPVHLRVPSAGTWFIVVMPTGGSVRASVQVIAA